MLTGLSKGLQRASPEAVSLIPVLVPTPQGRRWPSSSLAGVWRGSPIWLAGYGRRGLPTPLCTFSPPCHLVPPWSRLLSKVFSGEKHRVREVLGNASRMQ